MTTSNKPLASYIAKATERSDERVQAAEQALWETQEENFKLVLANILLMENIDRNAVIKTIIWDDDTNEDGSFDITLDDVTLDDEVVASLNSYGGIGAGIYLGEGVATHWDEFMDKGKNILASKVYEYAEQRFPKAL